MSSSQLAPTARQSKRGFVRTIASRPYPAFARPFVDFDPEHLPPVDLAEQIEAVIRSRMTLAPGCGVYQDIPELMDDYSQSIQVVRQATAEVRQMFDALWSTNTSFHAVGQVNARARDEFLTALRKQLSAQVDLRLTPPSNVLSATLEAEPVGQVEIELRNALDNAVRGLATQVCDLLDRMTDHDLVGLVDWPTDSACDAYFYRYLIAQEQLSKELIAGNWRVVAIHDQDLVKVFEVARETFQVEKGRHIQLHTMYWLYLTGAKANRVEDFFGVMPPNIRKFLDSLPDWLRGLVRIVDGKRRHEEISVLDVRVENYETAKVVQVHEAEVNVYDPLVTLGHYVLTGWGEEEINTERARQWSLSLLILSVLLLFLAAGLVALGQLAHVAFGIGAAVVGGLGLAVFLAERNQRSIAERRAPSLVRLGMGGLWWIVVSMGIFMTTMGLASRQWLLVATGVSVLVALGAAWGLAKGRGDEE